MHEHITRALYYFEIHLLYASIVWFSAWALTSIRGGSATTKYWIWVATSVNFIFPLGAVLDKIWAPHLSWAAPLGAIGDAAGGISGNTPVAIVLSVTWLLGASLMIARLCLRLRAERRALQAMSPETAHGDSPGFLAQGVPVEFAGACQVPAVDGVLRPRITLPTGIDRLLSRHELNAVLIHEVTHARRRDNLIRLVHEVALCALWFHPLVWITGSRLSLYRELSCDESVIRRDHGRDLISALAKIANPEGAFLLQARASSFLMHRLARLAAPEPCRSRGAVSILLSVVFGAALLGGVFETVAHTACCFVARIVSG